MKIYCFSGLGADKRVFEELQIKHDLIHIEWITVTKNASIEEYALQLSHSIQSSEVHILMGVSFGGLIAIEVSKITKPKQTILISSAEVKSELKPMHRFAGKLGITKIIPRFIIIPPAGLLAFLFGTKRKKLLKEILNDSDAHFMKWAINALCSWKNTERIEHILKISGDRDKLMRVNQNSKIIQNGKHLMIMDRAIEISHIINSSIEKIEST